MSLENQDKINDIYIRTDQFNSLLTILSTAIEEYPYELSKKQMDDLLSILHRECSWIKKTLYLLVKWL